MAKSVAKNSGRARNKSRRRWSGRVLLDKIAEAVLNSILFVFRFVWWGFRWSAATAILLAVMGLSAFYVLDRAMAGGEQVQVPDIKGLPITEASHVLAQHGLEIGQQREMVSDEVPRFHVIAQRPEAGRVVRTGRKVYPTVSGVEHASAPNLVGKSLSEAQDMLQHGRFRLGSLARIPHDSPGETVLSQYPPPDSRAERTGEISLLLSAGASEQRYLMPDLTDMPVEEALETLRELGVRAQANPVDRRGERPNVVLGQHPAPGAILREDTVVIYDVRATGEVRPAPDQRRVEVTYTLPRSPVARELRVEAVDRTGRRRTVYPRQQDYVDGSPPRFEGQTSITIPFQFHDELTVEIYLDGEKVRTYYYRGDDVPVISDHDHFFWGNT